MYAGVTIDVTQISWIAGLIVITALVATALRGIHIHIHRHDDE